MLHVLDFLAVRGFFRMICLIHNLPDAGLVGFKSLFHGSTFPVEEQVWKWGGASWHASIVTNHLSPLLSFYHEEDMSLSRPVAALTCWACQLTNTGLHRFDKEAKFKNTLDIDGLNMSEQNTYPNVSRWCHGKIRQWCQSVDTTYI